MPFFQLPTVPILDLLVWMFAWLMLLLPIYTFTNKALPVRKDIWFAMGCALLLAALSSLVLNGRGGLPPGIAYGWPKELFQLREGDLHVFFVYGLIDLLFYGAVIYPLLTVVRLITHRQPLETQS